MSKTASNTESSIDATTYDGRSQLRAHWEDLSFTLGAPGHVKVANHSYGPENATDHTYLVAVIEGESEYCTCPADEYRPGKCKHRRAVESNEPVMLAAGASEGDVRAARGMDQ